MPAPLSDWGGVPVRAESRFALRSPFTGLRLKVAPVKQATPRLQHYVPQFLLRRFAGAEGRLWAYDAVDCKMFCTRPKSLAAEGYFYGATTKRATRKSTAIETWLAKEIDGPGADAIAGLHERRKLAGEQAVAFFRFVAAQMHRTPASLQRANDSCAPTFQEMVERMVKYDPEVRRNVISEARAKGATAGEISELTRILDQGRLTVTPTRDFNISISLSTVELVAAELAKMQWTFLDVHPADGDLIIGDHPVTLTDVGPEGTPPGALGVKNPYIEIAMPLSRRLVALAHWDGPISYGELAPGMVDMLNVRTLRYLHRFAYAALKSEELLARAIALHGTGPKTLTRRIEIGEKLVISTEFG